MSKDVSGGDHQQSDKEMEGSDEGKTNILSVLLFMTLKRY